MDATEVAVTCAEDVWEVAHVLGMAFELNDEATDFDCSFDGEGGGPGAFGSPGPFVCIGYITLCNGVLTIPFKSGEPTGLLAPLAIATLWLLPDDWFEDVDVEDDVDEDDEDDEEDDDEDLLAALSPL